MTSSSNYQFYLNGQTYSGVIPTGPGVFQTGTSEVVGVVSKSGVVAFRGVNGHAITGQLNVASNLALDSFASMGVNDLLTSGTEQVTAINVGFLSLTGAATDSVAVTASGTGSALFSGLAGGTYAITAGAHAVEFSKVALVDVQGTGTGGGSDAATVTEDTQATRTIVAKLGTATLNLASGSIATPDLVQASGIGTLDVNGSDHGGLKLEGNGLGTVNILGEDNISYAETQASAGLTLTASDMFTLTGGNFVLMGGNETVTVSQSFGTVLKSGQSAFVFNLAHSVTAGPGDTITFNQAFASASPGNGAHDATFLLGAGAANITIGGNNGAPTGGRIAFIGGAGTATIHGGAGGSDVTLGTGRMDVTGGSGQNSYTFGAYGAATTRDTIEDFKIGTDVLNLSSNVESQTTFTATAGGTAIAFGHHTIDVAGVHVTAANVTWTH